ncbi:MAG: DNA topoisomerase IB [Proteobacteria bacterium]|nr:MAG: DNA topoisomerase IB [Pseudomonadota bacterium]
MSLRAVQTSNSETKDSQTSPAVARSIAQAMDAAKEAGLRYVSDTSPGLTRKKAGGGFKYVDSHGKVIADKKVRERINMLKIPPAWEQVWICAQANGHIQCTGRDEKGRKQYLYHADWRKFRDETKYTRLLHFGQKLEAIRKQVRKDLKLRGLPKRKVLASVVAIMDQSMIRIGNAEYAKKNDSFGLTTMRHKHVKVRGSKITFHFRGKSGKEHDIEVSDPVVAKVVKTCQDLPGQELFAFKNENGELVDIGSHDVNEYIKEITGEGFTAKDFRTWGGSVCAAKTLFGLGPCDSPTKAKRNFVAAVKETAALLGNTVAVCKKSYIHPSIAASQISGLLYRLKTIKGGFKGGLDKDERFFMSLLKSFTRAKTHAAA